MQQDDKSTTTSSIPTTTFEFESPLEFQQDSFDDYTYDSFEDPVFVAGHRDAVATRGIPGLDLVKEIPMVEKQQDDPSIINLDYDEPVDDTEPPPIPKFGSSFKRHVIDIRDILEHPIRNQRHDK
jgi:hypothetical protein